MGIVLLALMRSDTAGVHRWARVRPVLSCRFVWCDERCGTSDWL